MSRSERLLKILCLKQLGIESVSHVYSSSRGKDEGDGGDESEGGAIDRALKLLGLDGRRTSSHGRAR